MTPRAWRPWDDLAEVFALPSDADWPGDRDLVDNTLTDPWEDR
ncbi:hypothetical protein FRAAL0564 [Frankia alni ACN14a]|uniref:Uncharacterized protein n=1 Tax=Frankia alni (strain DSM 45986 / CECT 9034 / ACN14a) TaxID=326424 RepID=Q0RT63_FRAAA|nr:hypothetical protein FRAAL0564 [Frankia alni ACN14a]